MNKQRPSLTSRRDQQQQRLAGLQAKHPEKFSRPTSINPDDILQHIGITGLSARPSGYIRLFPTDFIVEELCHDHQTAAIEPAAFDPDVDLTQPTLYADLVKIALGTPEAVQQLAMALHVQPEKIGYAGIKDASAITSQRISIRGANWNKVNQDLITNFFVKPQHAGKGAIAVGQLQGNKFTILIRTDAPANEQALADRISNLAQSGYANFYGVQRFGHRLLNPQLGRLLCQGRFSDAIKMFLIQPGPFDTPIYREVRQAAAKSYGDWPAMRQAFDLLAYSLRHECTVLETLIDHPGNNLKALMSIQDQVRFWIYGYVSFLVNHLLSHARQQPNSVPSPLPLPLSGPEADQLYRSYLNKHAINDYAKHLSQLPYFQQKERSIQPYIKPQLHHIKSVPAGVILSFTLPKASYATTFLLSLFNLYEGTPVPSWVKQDFVDTKSVLGTGSVKAALDVLQFTPQLPFNSSK